MIDTVLHYYIMQRGAQPILGRQPESVVFKCGKKTPLKLLLKKICATFLNWLEVFTNFGSIHIAKDRFPATCITAIVTPNGTRRSPCNSVVD